MLSESTERYDRDGKFQAYKQIASLEVSQETRMIEVFRRSLEWAGDVARSGGSITVHGARLDVDTIYGPAT